MSEAEDELQPIIVKKIKKGGGHHGGAWKVAYADFVTAMMAFFLLLWLLNVTTSEQKSGIADYFSPNERISDGRSGAGGLMGGLTISPEGTLSSQRSTLIQTASPTQTNPALRPNPSAKETAQKKAEARKKQRRESEQRKFKEAQRKLEAAVENNPTLKKLLKNLMVDTTPEGLRIQVIDQDDEPMFASGSAQMFAKTRTLLTEIASVLEEFPNEISVRGHTDSTPYAEGATYTNWELSADRSNSSRRVLLDAGISIDRLNNVMGKADREHLIMDNPRDARNRRISIILLREELTNPDLYNDIEDDYAAEMAEIAAEEAANAENGDGTEDGMIDDTPLSPEDLPLPERPLEQPLFEQTPGTETFLP